MRHYSGDPYVLTTRYRGHCAGCGGQIPAGAKAWYYPRSKTLYGLAGYPCKCGDTERTAFHDAAFDESMLSGEW
jgi:hypothetical protein